MLSFFPPSRALTVRVKKSPEICARKIPGTNPKGRNNSYSALPPLFRGDRASAPACLFHVFSHFFHQKRQETEQTGSTFAATLSAHQHAHSLLRGKNRRDLLTPEETDLLLPLCSVCFSGTISVNSFRARSQLTGFSVPSGNTALLPSTNLWNFCSLIRDPSSRTSTL